MHPENSLIFFYKLHDLFRRDLYLQPQRVIVADKISQRHSFYICLYTLVLYIYVSVGTIIYRVIHEIW